MIELIKVGKYFPTSSGRNYLFRNVSLVLPPNKNVGVIGPNGAGKSTFLRLLSGAELPSEGRIVRSGKISWSLGMSPGLQNTMNGVENTRFAARIYGMRSHEIKATIEKVRELADVGKYFDMPLHTYSAGMRQKLSFAMSMAMEFEYYLFDEISAGGDARFRERTQQMIKERLAKANFVVVTHKHSEIVELCHACILIGGGNLTYFDDVQEAIGKYNELFGSEETERKAQKLAARRAARAAREAGGEAAGNVPAQGRRRTTPLPMAPRRPAAAAPEPPPLAAAGEAGAASGEAPVIAAVREEKLALAAQKREQAAAKKQAAEERRQAAAAKAGQRDERKAAIAAKHQAALERKAKVRAGKLAARQVKQAAARAEKRAAAAARTADSGAVAGPKPRPIVQLRQSIAALKERLAAMSGESDPAERNGVRRELAEARRQMQALVAARRGAGNAAAPGGEPSGAAAATAIANQQQSDE